MSFHLKEHTILANIYLLLQMLGQSPEAMPSLQQSLLRPELAVRKLSLPAIETSRRLVLQLNEYVEPQVEQLAASFQC